MDWISFTIPLPVMGSHSGPTVSVKHASDVQFRGGGEGGEKKERKRGEGAGERERPARQTGRSGSRLASSRRQRSRLRPKRCGTDGGLRHRKKRRTPHHSKSLASIDSAHLTAFRTTEIRRLWPPTNERSLMLEAGGGAFKAGSQ